MTEPSQVGVTVPIGRPIANTQVYVLDRAGQPVPVGVPGELYIGGDGLARAYLNQPALTAERFVPHPFSAVPGARLYRTGDRVRYRADGNLEFLGRLDQQVKIRGFRIEVGEVEAVLGHHPALREVVVTAREEAPGDKRLVAYVVPHRGQAPTSSGLRSFLQAKLPDYMVPATFVLLDALPLTPNGKVNHRALPAPDRTRPNLKKTAGAHRDALELQLTRIWEKVLNVTHIGVQDNFFEVGGHSLLALQLLAQIKKTWDQNLPLTALFQAPTIEQLADVLRHRERAALSPLIAVQPAGTKSPFFCVHGYNSYVYLARHLGTDQPFYGLAQHLAGKQVRHTRIEDIAAYYLTELRPLQPTGPYFLGGHSLGGLIAFEMAQQLRKQGQDVALLALFEPTPPGVMARELPRSSFYARAVHHLGNLSFLSPQGKLTYVLQRIHERIKRRVKTVACTGYHLLGRPLSPGLQTFYVEEIVYGLLYRKAARAYVPRVYPGQVTLFKGQASASDQHCGWDKLAAGGLEVHELPGGHLDMIQAPYVWLLAEQLRVCLHKAQAEAGVQG
jgi:aspartate racemase